MTTRLLRSKLECICFSQDTSSFSLPLLWCLVSSHQRQFRYNGSHHRTLKMINSYCPLAKVHLLTHAACCSSGRLYCIFRTRPPLGHSVTIDRPNRGGRGIFIHSGVCLTKCTSESGRVNVTQRRHYHALRGFSNTDRGTRGLLGDGHSAPLTIFFVHIFVCRMELTLNRTQQGDGADGPAVSMTRVPRRDGTIAILFFQIQLSHTPIKSLPLNYHGTSPP